MKKILTLFLALSLCVSLLLVAEAEGITEKFNYEGAEVAVSVDNVLDKRTVTLTVEDYDYETEEIVQKTVTLTLYQIPYTGATLSVSLSGGDTYLYPGGGYSYRLSEGAYIDHPEYPFMGQIGFVGRTTPWTFWLSFAECGFQETDIISIDITWDDSICFTCADLDDIIAAAGVKAETSATPFTDVPADAYYTDAVKWAYENGITTGTSETTFGPKETCTRGQVVTFLWRANGCPEPTSTVNPFTDVKESDYFYKAVLWAVEKGITNGMTETTFGPKETCTSGHVVTFLWRANGQPAAVSESTLVENGKWYSSAVAWADSVGLLSGTDVAFAVGNNAPRADIVTYLYRNIAK